ncbi:MAG TPA: flagellar motor protein PomA [Rhodospirillaceae bacterium]|nr:flagellar motor protein PomA [Rhodospirillaceae bacterium]
MGAFGVVLVAILMGSGLSLFIDIPSIFIVFGGTTMAALVRFPAKALPKAMATAIKVALTPDPITPRQIIDVALDLAQRARTGGVLALQSVQIEDVFFAKGIQQCVDNQTPDFIRKAMSADRDMMLERHDMSETIFRTIADVAPAFGMIGTLVGLVQMLANMSDPSSIGPSMAVAILTTLYGSMIANIIASPIADKLARRTAQDRLNKTMIIEAVLQIQARQNTMLMQEILASYLPEKQRPRDDEDEAPGGAAAQAAAGA